MKEIINGKKYDTETATELATGWNGFARGDFDFCNEALFRKRNGEYFLCGEGGPRSKYAKSVGISEWDGGSGIIPISEDQAKNWAERYLDADEYEEIFGEVEE